MYIPKRSRRFFVWFAISVAVHVALALIPMKKPTEALTTVSSGPLTVELVPKQEQVATAPEVVPEPRRAEPPPRITKPVVPPRTIVHEGPKAVVPLPPPEQPPTPPPAPPPREPPMDMMAAIQARRSAREAAEAAMARGPHNPSEAELAKANIERNLNFNPGDGVGGVFQILSKSQLSAEFQFNGWEPSRNRTIHDVIEVHVPPGQDIERGIVRRMIQLIREHYTGDFRWESRRLGRIVVLSARPADNDGLEDFLIREFFGTPTER